MCGGRGYKGKSLYLFLNFVLNLKFILKNKVSKIKRKKEGRNEEVGRARK